ncbi:MAG: hypothetical protein ACE5GE_16620 [Phycisphaerae bacterium]
MGDQTNNPADPTTDESASDSAVGMVLALPSGSVDAPIELHLFWPEAGGARFGEGAPVVVVVPGGHRPSLAADETDDDVIRAVQRGFIHVSFSMPGTLDEETGRGTGGAYDYRGPTCQRALADTILFALGRLADTDGKSITDHVSFAKVDNVGVVGLSNGGNLVLTTLAAHGSELDSLGWLVTWESPIGDQYVTVELGSGTTLNPYYTPGTSTTTAAPWPGMGDALAFDATQTVELEDPATRLATTVTGALFLDQDGDGSLDAGEFPFSPVGGPGTTVGSRHLPKGYTSVELAELVADNAERLFPEGMPVWLADLDEVKSYWADRDGSLAIGIVTKALPELSLLALATEQDHVQSQPDHPHVRSLVNGWLEAGGGWVRLNPDAGYLAELTGEPASQFPDTVPNVSIPYPGIEAMVMPETVNEVTINSTIIVTAAMMEMADRAEGVFLSE